MQPPLDVERGTAPEGTVPRADFEDLSEGGFDHRGGHPDRGHHPHPKDRAGSPYGERDSDTGDVACTHPRRQAHAERLKGRNPTVLAVGSAELAKHATEVADLNTSGAHREIEAYTDEQINEDVSV